MYFMKWLVFNFGALILHLLFACNGNSNMTLAPDSSTPAALQAVDTLHYLALGDSYTIGEGVGETERFPFLTVALLRAKQVAVANPHYLATTGWTTQDLLHAIHQASFSKTYDLVSLLCGVNDQYQHLDTSGYRTRFSQLLDEAVALAGHRSHRVFVLSIPDYSATPFVAEAEKANVHDAINTFNAINKELTLSRSIAYIDITPATRNVTVDRTLLASDNLHYSCKEHQVWAELLAPVMLKNLEK